MEELDQIVDWIKKYQDNGLDDSELLQLKAWLAADDLNQRLFDRLNDRGMLIEELNNFYDAPVESMRGKIAVEFPGVVDRRVRVIKMRWLRYAAVLLFVAVGAAGVYIGIRNKVRQSAGQVTQRQDVPPGGNHAMLTLADGRRVRLDSAGFGAVAEESGMKVVKRGDGLVAYEGDGTAPGRNGVMNGNLSTAFNTISTPRGGQYQVVLPDGTKVWLNADSQIDYPVVFTGKTREVSIRGEAYFEVAKNSRQPFIVKFPAMTRAEGESGRWMSIEVLGTSFNINNYYDEPDIRTTLIEGSIKIQLGSESMPGKSVVLRPGQQAATKFGKYNIEVAEHINSEAVVAWKNGVFDFQDRTTGEIMRQLARWYDINISYPKGIPAAEFAGRIGKDLSLQQVLKGLSNSGLHLQLESNKTLVVLP